MAACGEIPQEFAEDIPIAQQTTSLSELRRRPSRRDADGDHIPNRRDNCPRTYNPEQLDRNGSGRGDACDAWFEAYAESSDRDTLVYFARLNRQTTIPLGRFTNNGRETTYIEGETEFEGLRLEPLAVEPGEQAVVRVQFDGDFKFPYPIRTKLTLHFGFNIYVPIIIIISNGGGNSEPETCDIDMTMFKVRVTQGQGIAEGKLELRITGIADGSTEVWPSSTGYDQLKDGGPWETIDEHISTITLTQGSVRTVSVTADVLEIDGGLLGADDYGSATSTIEIACGMLPATETVTVDLFRENMGSYKGKVQVQFKAEEI